MRVLLLSRYSRLGASSRVRFFQYLPYLEAKGWKTEVSPLFSDGYLEAFYAKKPRWTHVVKAYWSRFRAVAQARRFDLIWIEKELLPYFPAAGERLLERLGVPYVVDFDDALFHQYERHNSWLVRKFLGRKIDTVMMHAALVIVGNDYLAERARSAGAEKIEVIPTVVDLRRYRGGQHKQGAQDLVVGWIGSPATSGYLALLAPVCESLKEDFDVRFVALGASEKFAKGNVSFEAMQWSEETEVESIKAFDIGIMPLVDSPWERGKCGYKLIQYMACGLPVVASPVGVNTQIVKSGENGYLATTVSQWEEVLRVLLNDGSLRRRMGAKGREDVEAWFSMQIQAPRIEAMMRNILERS